MGGRGSSLRQSGGGVNFKEDLTNYVAGGFGSPTEAMDPSSIAYIRRNMEPTSQSLYRIEDSEFTASNLSVGDTFSFQGDIRSFSRRESFVKDAMDEVYYDNPVVFRTVGTTKQFNVNKAIDNTYFGNQQESLVSGRFKVEKVYTRNGLTYYDIRQVRQ